MKSRILINWTDWNSVRICWKLRKNILKATVNLLGNGSTVDPQAVESILSEKNSKQGERAEIYMILHGPLIYVIYGTVRVRAEDITRTIYYKSVEKFCMGLIMILVVLLFVDVYQLLVT